MSEPRKNRLSIDGGQLKDDEHVASYKPIPDSETDIRTSKSSLSKSKEKVSSDGAEEKLLQKEDEAKIITRVDMADAKYVVGDHRNGDAKIELDANKQEFTGLTKEELMRYADDPFWINLRWSLFVLFWAAWLCLLAGAIVIIVRAPKCYPPEPKHWYERGPIVDVESPEYEEFKADLKMIDNFDVEGIFMDVPTYEILDQPAILNKFQSLFTQANEYGIKVIVDLIPNSVSVYHNWFLQSVNRTDPYTDYFVWRASNNYDKDGKREPPNKWVSISNTSAWTFNEQRNEFYLSQYGGEQADLNFRNADVQGQFDKVIEAWIKAGASGIRLNRARQLLVDPLFGDEKPESGRGRALGADHTHYAFWQHTHTTDQPGLTQLLDRFANKLAKTVSLSGEADPSEAVFTLAEESGRPELFLSSQNVSMLRPRPAATLLVTGDANAVAASIAKRLGSWPAIQLKTDEDNLEIAAFALLLPAVPVFSLQQLRQNESLSHLVKVRDDPTIAHGQYLVSAVPAANNTDNELLVCARWKPGHTGYLAVYNLGLTELRANLTGIPSVPDSVTIHHVSSAVREITDYNINQPERADNVLVPSNSTVVVSFVPRTTVEE